MNLPAQHSHDGPAMHTNNTTRRYPTAAARPRPATNTARPHTATAAPAAPRNKHLVLDFGTDSNAVHT